MTAPKIALPANVDVPDWIPSAASELVALADRLFVGEKRGPERKAFVADNLKRLAREHDLKAIPDWIETPIETVLIDVFVEFAFSHFKVQFPRRTARNARSLTSG